jgi:hypothetical protein
MFFDVMTILDKYATSSVCAHEYADLKEITNSMELSQSFSYSRFSQHLMEPEGSLPS